MNGFLKVIGVIFAYATCALVLFFMGAPTYIQVIGGWIGVLMWNQK